MHCPLDMAAHDKRTFPNRKDLLLMFMFDALKMACHGLSHRIYVWVRAKQFGYHSVWLRQSVCHHRKSLSGHQMWTLNILCSTATSLSSLMGKVIFYCTFACRKLHKVQKVKKVIKTVFAPKSFILHCMIDGMLEDLSLHNLHKCKNLLGKMKG